MAACNFRRGLILFNLQRQMAMSQKNATFSTSTVILGGGHAPSKYELHGGEKQKLPIGKKYFILCYRGLSFFTSDLIPEIVQRGTEPHVLSL